MEGKMPPSEVSVGVNSKEWLLRFKLSNKTAWFVVLVYFLLLCQKKISASQKIECYQKLKVIKIFIRSICAYMGL